MIISPSRGYIFVHIPKTGGTAMALALEDRARADDILIGDTPKAVKRRRRLKGLKTRGRLWKHSTLADIDGFLSPQDIRAMVTFTLVRNPWDRIVSYYHWLGAQNFDHQAVVLAKSLEFCDFLMEPHTQASLSAWPAAAYMRLVDGRIHATHFIRLEHLQEDMAPLAKHLGFNPDVPHANRSARDADYRRYYDEETAALVAKICAADVAQFGYTF